MVNHDHMVTISTHHGLPTDQWPFQVTIYWRYLPYIRPKFQGVSQQKVLYDNSHWNYFRYYSILYLELFTVYPIGSMYAIYGNIYHQYTPNVSIYTSTMDPMGMVFLKPQTYSNWGCFNGSVLLGKSAAKPPVKTYIQRSFIQFWEWITW